MNEPSLLSRESMRKKGHSSQLELRQSAIALARMEGKGRGLWLPVDALRSRLNENMMFECIVFVSLSVGCFKMTRIA